MSTVLILQHTPYSGPAYFLDFLQQNHISANIIRLYAGDALPGQLDGYRGLALFGGAMSVNDIEQYDWMAPEIELIRLAIAQQVPVIGHCLGGQLLARALGATVRRAGQPEIGWIGLQYMHENAARWFDGKAAPKVFQWHRDTFDLPAEATLLAASRWCQNQMFEYKDIHLGMQFHCEVDAPMIRNWLDEAGHEVDAHDLPSVMPRPLIAASLASDIPASQQFAAAIYRQWIKGLRQH